MKLRYAVFALISILLFNITPIQTAAASEYRTELTNEEWAIQNPPLENIEIDSSDAMVLATNQFNWSIASGVTKKSSTALSLEVNEVVTINATFSPTNSSVDFGLIAPDGSFYYSRTTGGNFKKSIQVDQTGKYYLAIRNNSSDPVRVMGFIYY